MTDVNNAFSILCFTIPLQISLWGEKKGQMEMALSLLLYMFKHMTFFLNNIVSWIINEEKNIVNGSQQINLNRNLYLPTGNFFTDIESNKNCQI